MSTIDSTEPPIAKSGDPIQHMENIGTALIQASEALHEHAEHIVANIEQAVATLAPD